jgi:hypothetical protein
MINDSIPITNLFLHATHYFESGLNHNSQYQVEILNPFSDNVMDLRYLQIFNATPQYGVKLAGPISNADLMARAHSFSHAPDPQRGLQPGVIAGIVVSVNILKLWIRELS